MNYTRESLMALDKEVLVTDYLRELEVAETTNQNFAAIAAELKKVTAERDHALSEAEKWEDCACSQGSQIIDATHDLEAAIAERDEVLKKWVSQVKGRQA